MNDFLVTQGQSISQVGGFKSLGADQFTGSNFRIENVHFQDQKAFSDSLKISGNRFNDNTSLAQQVVEQVQEVSQVVQKKGFVLERAMMTAMESGKPGDHLALLKAFADYEVSAELALAACKQVPKTVERLTSLGG